MGKHDAHERQGRTQENSRSDGPERFGLGKQMYQPVPFNQFLPYVASALYK